MDLFPGDLTILQALYTYRYLTSGQLARLTRRDAQIIRRAMRKRLRPGGFVVEVDRRPTEEAAYVLGEGGFALIAHEMGCTVHDLPGFRKASTVRGFFFRHTLLISELRVAFDLAAQDAASPICIARAIPEWETAPSAPSNGLSRERLVLFERLNDAEGGVHVHRPDCLFLMYAKAKGPEQIVAAFVEADRNTESIRRVIRAKYEAYYVYFRRRLFARDFRAVAMRVLFVLDDVKDHRRIESMQEELRQFVVSRREDTTAAEAFRRSFRFARKRDLDETSVLTKPIWRDAENQPRLFFQPVHTEPRRSPDAGAAA